jgi:hypothetical protein
MMSAVEGTIDEILARVRGFYDLPSSRAPRQAPMNRATTAMPDAAGAVA